MEKKYILTDETIEYLGRTLHRIQAVKDFGTISAGTLGGYIESETNLDHTGDAWVYGSAWVYDNARVSGNARVDDDAWVSDDAMVSGNARVFGDAWVSGDARVDNNARVFGDARVSGDAMVSGDAWVSGDAVVFGNAIVSGNARVDDDARVFGNVIVFGNAIVSGNARVDDDAWVHKPSDIASIKGFGSEFRATSFFRCVDGLVRCQCGCFYGTLDEFRKKVKETHGNSKFAKEYLAIADLMEMHFKEEQ